MGITKWDKFKEEEKIFTGEDYVKCPDGWMLLASEDEVSDEKKFNSLIKELKAVNAEDWKIGILTNEDGEYFGCYAEEITINNVKIGASLRGRADETDDFEPSWAELSFQNAV